MSGSSKVTETTKMWALQDRHTGDRLRLFQAVASVVEDPSRCRVLYPGSYVDVSPSMVFSPVTYIDVDKRAARFFADDRGVTEIVSGQEGAPREPGFHFIHADYSSDVGLNEDHYDLLVSLYAGFVSEHCGKYLKVGGTLLVNPSHGDAAMASIDPRFELSGVIAARDGDYTVRTSDLDSYLIPKRPLDITVDSLHELGRGIGYTKSPFAYLFTRTS